MNSKKNIQSNRFFGPTLEPEGCKEISLCVMRKNEHAYNMATSSLIMK